MHGSARIVGVAFWRACQTHSALTRMLNLKGCQIPARCGTGSTCASRFAVNLNKQKSRRATFHDAISEPLSSCSGVCLFRGCAFLALRFQLGKLPGGKNSLGAIQESLPAFPGAARFHAFGLPRFDLRLLSGREIQRTEVDAGHGIRIGCALGTTGMSFRKRAGRCKHRSRNQSCGGNLYHGDDRTARVRRTFKVFPATTRAKSMNCSRRGCLYSEAMILDPVRPIQLSEIEQARKRIARTIVRTPLVRLELGPDFPDIRLKLENLQPINAYKLRGAANAVALLSPQERQRGVWTVSAGNAGQGVAYAARQAGVPCTVVAIETAPETKIARMRALGATIVKASFDACWEALQTGSYPGVGGTFVHPFDDDRFIAGNGTAGLEILEDLPGVAAIVAAMGGGGLITGVASAVRAKKPGVRVFVAEPETAAPYARSLEAGKPSAFEAWQPTFVDGAGGKSVFPRMWERMHGLVDGSIVVTLDEIRDA